MMAAKTEAQQATDRIGGCWGVWALGLIAVVLAGCAGGDEASQTADTQTTETSAEPTEPATVTVSGDLTLEGEGFDFGKGQSCYGEDGYSDIDEGAQVTIRDGDGTKVALGVLGQGIARGLRGIDCVFPFTVADVPTGGGIYSVEVGSRGEVSFEESEAEQISLSLG